MYGNIAKGRRPGLPERTGLYGDIAQGLPEHTGISYIYCSTPNEPIVDYLMLFICYCFSKLYYYIVLIISCAKFTLHMSVTKRMPEIRLLIIFGAGHRS